MSAGRQTKLTKRASPSPDEVRIAHRRAVHKADENLSFDPSANRLVIGLKRWLSVLKQRFASQKSDWPNATDDPELLAAIDSVQATGWLPLLYAHLGNSSLTGRWREILPTRAMGKALSQLTAERLDVEVFPFVSWILDHLGWLSSESFLDEATAYLQRHPAKQHFLEDMVTKLTQQMINGDDPFGCMHAPLTMNDLIEHWAANASQKDLWSEGMTDSVIHIWNPWPFILLSTVNPEAFVYVLNEIPHPAIARQILQQSSSRSDERTLLRWFRSAGLAFDDQGAWIPGAQAPVLLLGRLLEKLREYAGPQLDKTHPKIGRQRSRYNCQRNFSIFNKKLLQNLRQRRDAVPLTWALLQQLAFEDTKRQFWQVSDRVSKRVRTDALWEIAQAVSSLIEPRADYCEWIESEQYLWRLDRFTAVAVVLSAAP
jgi:hypothetical protein